MSDDKPKKKKGNVVININPFDAQVKCNSDNSFTLTFMANIGGDYARRKIVNVHFEAWWIKVIIRLVWDVINTRRKEVDEIESKMRNGSAY